MKRGLKLIESPRKSSFYLLCYKARPDEEGIETCSMAGEVPSCCLRYKARPDEEGIETYSTNSSPRSSLTSYKARPDEEGIETLL